MDVTLLRSRSPVRDVESVAMRGSGVRLVGLGTLLGVCCSLPDYAFVARVEPSCEDLIPNGSETDLDCGGDCAPCENGSICRSDSDCAVGSCIERTCRAVHCVDQQLGDGETDVDCGGSECPRCGVHQRCGVASDCTSNSCMNGECVATGCDDDVVDGDETDLNCGGGTCPACSVGGRCELGGDCDLGVCLEGVCSTEACGNGLRDPAEDGVDCGGSCPRPCDAADKCSNGDVTEAETDVDCGGGICARCADDLRCLLDADCTSGRCLDLVCTPACPDGGCGEGGGDGAGGAGTGGTGGVTGGAGSGGAGTSGGGASATAGMSQGGAGLGGMAGGGTGGMAGTAQAGAGAGGTSGTESGGSGGGSSEIAPEPTCPSCARLEVPLVAASDKANFVISLGSAQDFSSSVIRYLVYRQAGSGGQIKGYVQHSGSPDFAQLFQSPGIELATLDGWQTLTWDVGAQTGNYDKTIVARVGLQIVAAGSTSFTNPTVLYLDRVEVSGSATGVWRFEAPDSISTTSMTSAPAGILFCNSGDSPVAGSRVSWYAN